MANAASGHAVDDESPSEHRDWRRSLFEGSKLETIASRLVPRRLYTKGFDDINFVHLSSATPSLLIYYIPGIINIPSAAICFHRPPVTDGFAIRGAKAHVGSSKKDGNVPAQ
jgi:hypothetical protein